MDISGTDYRPAINEFSVQIVPRTSEIVTKPTQKTLHFEIKGYRRQVIGN